ncbi:MAG: VWA domain-containing protein, partial [Planctomycetota bacterium]
NLQLGLRQARQILARRSATNKQIFVITDGQPTAHVQPGEGTDEEMLYLLYPPTEQTATITLEEAHKCQRLGIRIASFALIEDYYGMDWVSFIERITRLTRGIAYYCTSEDLASTVIESYLTGRKAKSFIH